MDCIGFASFSFTRALGYLGGQALRVVGSSSDSVPDQSLSQFEQGYPGCYTLFALLAGCIIEDRENRSECSEPEGLIDVH